MAIAQDFQTAVRKLASPTAPAAIMQDILANFAVLAPNGIDTPLKIAHFLSQTAHESGGFRIMSEGLRYSTAARLVAVFPKYFPNEAAAAPYVNNPEGLANFVYAGRMGNGPVASGDGYRFHGRGLIQITGRNNYTGVGKVMAVDLPEQPELAEAPGDCLAVAAATWKFIGCAALPETATVEQYTRKVNGGLNGLDDRKRLFAIAEKLLVSGA